MEERVEDYIKRIEIIIETLSDHIEFEDYDEDVLKEASKDKEALEKLLKDYKKLEEENNNYKKYAVIMSTDGLLINGVKFSFNDYIPTSVIQNKIDEIQEQYEETLKTADFKEIEIMNKTNFRGITLEGQRTILKELLEERNK